MGLHLQRISGAHERIMRRGYRADRPFRFQLVEPVERKNDVPIFLEPSAIEVDRDVAAQQIPGSDRRWDRPIIRIAAAKWVLPAHDEPGRRDNYYPTLRQRRAGHPGPRFKIRTLEPGQALGLVGR